MTVLAANHHDARDSLQALRATQSEVAVLSVL